MHREPAGIPARDLTFREELRKQRWDDHRFYHHSRVNQSLHLFSACCFLTSYVLLVIEPSMAPIVGWILAMTSRQIGHFFFEPKGFDEVNRVSHEHKEDIKVGYNLRRKVVLLTLWGLSPFALLLDPSLGGLLTPHTGWPSYIDNLALVWLALGAGGLLFRTVHLFFIANVQTGLVWFTKILTDPFNDVKLYARAPLALARGELIDPMLDVTGDQLDDGEVVPAGESDAAA
ncbi:MAG: hypothetical protein PVG24_14725 [Gammaproteobacteria bacterium]|jgi:hypothetical protein